MKGSYFLMNIQRDANSVPQGRLPFRPGSNSPSAEHLTHRFLLWNVIIFLTNVNFHT